MKSLTKILLLLASVSLLLIVSCDKEEETKPAPIENNQNDDDSSNITYGSISDIDGNTYKTVVIGTQTWIVENLKVTKYNDGTTIPNVTDNTEWANLTTGAYCNYDNDQSNVAIYGALYNWYAVETEKLCPTGWHVPTDAEWTQMENYLADNGYNYDDTTGGGRDKIAKALASSSGWNSYTGTGTVGNTDYPAKRNASGFTALPGGYRGSNGAFCGIGTNGYWWSATDGNVTYAWFRFMIYSYSNVSRFSFYKEVGLSVRCVRD